MGWKMEPCPRCGGPKATVAKQCSRCYHETTNSPICPSCGGKKSYDSKLCRKCQGAQGKSHKPCPHCGTRIQSARTQCLACYNKARAEKAAKYLCADCGQPTKQYASTRYAERCRACHLQKQKTQGRQTRLSTGLQMWKAKRALAAWPCQICSYHLLVSDIHRLTPGHQGGRYVVGNMVALCVRCHQEVHRGLTPAPIAPTENEIRATIKLD